MKTNHWQTRAQKLFKQRYGHQEDGRSNKLLQEIAQKRALGLLKSQKHQKTA